MKNLITILFIAILLTSCKNDSKAPVSVDESYEEVSVREISGNFIYYDDAAVFQTKNELFGVIRNEKLEELIAQSKPLKSEASDEVYATLKVKISKNTKNKEVWENWIDIKEIVDVSKVEQKENNIIKLETEGQS